MICTACQYINTEGKKYSGFLVHWFRKFLQKKFINSNYNNFYMYNPVIFSSVLIKSEIMKKYMPKVGNNGLDMMLRAASTQTSFDYISEIIISGKSENILYKVN